MYGPEPIGSAFAQSTLASTLPGDQMYCGRIGTHVMLEMATAYLPSYTIRTKYGSVVGGHVDARDVLRARREVRRLIPVLLHVVKGKLHIGCSDWVTCVAGSEVTLRVRGARARIRKVRVMSEMELPCRRIRVCLGPLDGEIRFELPVGTVVDEEAVDVSNDVILVDERVLERIRCLNRQRDGSEEHFVSRSDRRDDGRRRRRGRAFQARDRKARCNQQDYGHDTQITGPRTLRL